MQFLTESLIELITQTSTNLPPDVREAMKDALGTETPDTQAAQALGLVHGPLHAELRINEEGPWILEVAARAIGGL